MYLKTVSWEEDQEDTLETTADSSLDKGYWGSRVKELQKIRKKAAKLVYEQLALLNSNVGHEIYFILL